MYTLLYGEQPFNKLIKQNNISAYNSYNSYNSNSSNATTTSASDTCESITKSFNLNFPKGKITKLCKEIIAKLLEPIEAERIDLFDERICNWF